MRDEALKQAEMNVYKQQQQEANMVGQSCSAERQTARGVLEIRLRNLMREAEGIRALLQALPGSMGPLAEEALWQIVIEQRR